MLDPTTRPRPSLSESTRSDPGSIELVLDGLDLAGLLRTGLHPSALVCGRCGVSRGHHRPTDCPQFVRPELPEGYEYADQLLPDQGFRFLPTTDAGCIRYVEMSRCCVIGTMTELRSRASGCEPATHWVDGSLVVVTAVESD